MEDEATKGLDLNDSGAGKKPAPTGKKHLLAIGISNYAAAGGFNTLKYPVGDVTSFTQLLQTTYAFDHAKILKDEQCTSDEVIRAIVEQKKTLDKENDCLVVLFSGHGAVKDNIGYWITHDAKDPLELNLDIDKVLKQLYGCCRQVLVIVDCCCSGKIVEEAEVITVLPKTKNDAKKLLIITAGNKFEKVPDKSIFMETLLHLLSIKNFANFDLLAGEMKIKLSGKYTVVSFTSSDQEGQPFLLQRTDNVGYELKEAFYRFNYSRQTNDLEGVRLFNLVYLRGTMESGHHFFTQRYFKSNGLERFKELAKDPAYITFGNSSQDPDYTLWKKLASKIGLDIKDAATFNKNVFDGLKNRSYVWIAKVDSNCDNDVLEKALADFWTQINEFLLSKTRAEKVNTYHKIFFFIWDRRGDQKDEVHETLWSKPYDFEFVKRLHAPPIKPVEIEPLVNWYDLIDINENDYRNLKQEQAFTREKILAVDVPSTVDDAVFHLAKVFERVEVHKSLFKPELIWPQ